MVARRAHNPEVARFKSRLRTQNNKKDTQSSVLFVILLCAAADLPLGLLVMHDERGSLGLVPCRCRGQKQARHELRSSRILHRVNRGEQNSVTTRRDMFARTKLTYSPASAPQKKEHHWVFFFVVYYLGLNWRQCVTNSKVSARC